MVKKVWVLIALVAGLVLGFFLTTYGAYVFGFSTAEADGRTVKVAAKRAEARTPPTQAAGTQSAKAAVPARAMPAAPPALIASSEVDTARSPAPGGSIGFDIVNAEPEHIDYTNYSGYSLPVDAGPYFGAQIADSIRTGRNDSLTQEHLELEREVRDDSWSYPLEAELQNMLAADPVMGKFKVEHLECRATRCEVRVTSKAQMQQASAVNQWLGNMNRVAWPGGLTVGTAIFSGVEDGTEGMLILRRRPPAPAMAR